MFGSHKIEANTEVIGREKLKIVLCIYTPQKKKIDRGFAILIASRGTDLEMELLGELAKWEVFSKFEEGCGETSPRGRLSFM